jgi:hypothetical protein
MRAGTNRENPARLAHQKHSGPNSVRGLFREDEMTDERKDQWVVIEIAVGRGWS